MFVVTFLSFGTIPAIMLIIGILWKKSPPKNINGFYGYRTPRSMKSQEAWDFANKYLANLYFTWGVICTILTAVVLSIYMGRGEILEKLMIYVTIFQVACVTLPILPTELALKRNFDKDGKRL